jgi:hypothetical protein
MLISFIVHAVEPNGNLSQEMQAKIAQVQNLWESGDNEGGSKIHCIIFLSDLENFLKRKYKGSLRDLENSYQNAYVAERAPACPYEDFDTIIHMFQDLENDKDSFYQGTYDDYIKCQKQIIKDVEFLKNEFETAILNTSIAELMKSDYHYCRETITKVTVQLKQTLTNFMTKNEHYFFPLFFEHLRNHQGMIPTKGTDPKPQHAKTYLMFSFILKYSKNSDVLNLLKYSKEFEIPYIEVLKNFSNKDILFMTSTNSIRMFDISFYYYDASKQDVQKINLPSAKDNDENDEAENTDWDIANLLLTMTMPEDHQQDDGSEEKRYYKFDQNAKKWNLVDQTFKIVN